MTTDVDALSSWVQKVVDLVRDTSREVEALSREQRESIRDLKAEMERDNGALGKRIYAVEVSLAKLSEVIAMDHGLAQARNDSSVRSWQIKLAIVVATLAVIGNLFVWSVTTQVSKNSAAILERMEQSRE